MQNPPTTGTPPTSEESRAQAIATAGQVLQQLNIYMHTLSQPPGTPIPEAMPSNCFGTCGTLGTAGGCIGTAGTYGCARMN